MFNVWLWYVYCDEKYYVSYSIIVEYNALHFRYVPKKITVVSGIGGGFLENVFTSETCSYFVAI